MKPNKILLGILAVILIALSFFLFPIQRKVEQELTGLEIAHQSTQFLDSMRLPDNTYFLNKQCDGTRTESIPQSNAWALLAYSGLYEAHDSKALSMIDQELQTIFTVSRDLNGQAAFSLTAVQLAKAYAIAKREQLQSAPILLTFIVGYADTLSLIQDPSVLDSAMLLAIASRQLALTYQILGVDKYGEQTPQLRAQMLNKSYEYLSLAQSELAAEKPWFQDFKGDTCWVTLAQLELAQATGKDIEQVQTIFDTISFNQLETVPNELPPAALQPCIETLLILYRKTNQKHYLDQAISINQYLVSSKWDSAYNKQCTADNGFLLSAGSLKLHTDTAYQIYLLAQPELKDRLFKVSR
ncbi:MAG: hypothetical protein ABIG95_00890 [Candidatus Woesearchaeota archaeon]